MADWGEENLAGALGQTLAAEARAAFPALDINHDIEWLRASAKNADGSLTALSLRKEGRLVGLAPFQIAPSHLRLAIGGLTLMKKRVHRFSLESAPLLTAGLDTDALVACFATLADRLPNDGAVFLRAVPQSSPMHTLLTARGSPLRSHFHVVPHGPSYQRCRIRWDGSLETYLSSLGKVTRKDLKRTLRKAEERLGPHRLVRYTLPHEVDEFFRHADPIADRTYQATQLGLGLAQNTGLRAKFAYAARTGAFLGHVLFVGDEPAAFHCGYIHHQCFYMVDGGYDPRWSKAQIGIVTFLHVLQDLERHGDRVTLLDYLYGDGDYKKRTSNMAEPERHYYLIKRNVPGVLVAAAMRATDALSRGVGDALNKYGVKQALKRVLAGHKGHAALPLVYEVAGPLTSFTEMTPI